MRAVPASTLRASLRVDSAGAYRADHRQLDVSAVGAQAERAGGEPAGQPGAVLRLEPGHPGLVRPCGFPNAAARFAHPDA